MLFQNSPTPSLSSPQVRSGSPAPGCSTLITSAPNSPSMVATIGPAARVAASMTRMPRSGRSGSGTQGRGRALETQVIAQCRPRVPVPKDAPALQLRHDQADHVLVGAGAVRRRDDEPVAGAAFEPRLHLVGDVLTGAHEARALQQRGPVASQVSEGHGPGADV